MRRRVMAVTSAILIAACGGGAVTPSPSGSAPATGAPATTPPAAASPTPTRAPGAAFPDLIRAGKQASFKITYVFAATGGGQTAAVEQTWYASGSQMRWDLASPLGGFSSFFFIAEGIFLCVPEGQPACFKLPSDQQALANSAVLVQDAVWDAPGRFDAQPRAGRTIAGVPAQCFGVNDTEPSALGSGEMCYSAQGLLLFTQFKAPAGEFTMEAKNVGTPTAADFKLYAPVRTLP